MPLKHFNTPTISNRYKLVLLACLILLIYLPSLRAGFFVFDDVHIIEAIKRINTSEILPSLGASEGRYWRPLVRVSFLFDIHLLGANSSLMHLHNILLHITNTILVFFITRFLWSIKKYRSGFSLLAAVFFAIHPVNTESVNWISGRSDLYASLFALTGTYLFLISIHSKKVFFSLVSALFILLGCLAKEVAFPLFPAAILCLLLVSNRQSLTKSASQLTWKLSNSLPFIIGGISYIWFRDLAFSNRDQGIGKIIDGTTLTGPTLLDHTVTGITALGFYIKKFFIPYPLNFAIDNVSSLYLWVGLLSLFIVLLLVYKRNIESILLIFMLITIAPAILNAIFHIAWTPYAERYLYLPTAFMCTYLCAHDKPVRMPIGVQKLLVFSFLLFALTLTVYRNTQWGDSSKILADAIRQNPENTSLRINYAIALGDKFGPSAARDQLNIALSHDPENQIIRRNLALISMKLQKDPSAARKDLNVFFNGTQNPEKPTLSIMIDVNKMRLEQAEAEFFPIIKKELFLSCKQYYLLTGEPSYLFSAIENATSDEELEATEVLLQNMRDNP